MKKSIIKFSENIQLTLGLISAIGFAVFSYYILADKHLGSLPAMNMGYATACLMALWSLRSLGISMTMTPTSLIRKSPLGEVRIRWDEMERLEIGPFCFWLVFHGPEKRIWMRKPFSSFESWFSDENEEDHEDPILSSLFDMTEQHGITIESDFLTAFKTSRP